ncbi:AAA family ATPase [Halorussus sp. MSC15.2]|uniref:AAA family ATPase n=1 Tax=Halorussus sp. MSC15.2 TaxID=2283638 RepID=UPI0013CF5569|nr:AAA family ATPase [Halorussus sp. MSC15.2]NEU58407.1 CpsD/CapB family tyrosine-protein kinase [Halorussus sp. MSC15.2]
MAYSTAALVGATGGAGTTRLAVELGATLARDGREVAILDAAFATEGLARHVSGRIDADVTALLTEDETVQADRLPAEGLREHPATADLAGRLALCPAHAPFERLARAKTTDAARRFETLLGETASAYDHVLVDAPPVASNQAVAAVTAAECVAVVAPASERGVDALQRARGRVADVGASVDAVVANRAEPEHPVRSADAAVPESEVRTVEGVPASAPDPETAFAPAVAHVAEVVFDAELGLEFEESGLLDFDAEELLPDALS